MDTGLACDVVGADERRLRSDRTLLGAMMETFVTMDLTKQASWSETQPALYHVRTTSGREVDVVLEDGAGRLVGVEVKARATVTADDFKGLRTFSQAAGDRFVRGVVLYTGRQVVPFAPSLHAIPVTALWSG